MNTTVERGVHRAVDQSMVRQYTELAGRILLATLFLVSGFGKVDQYGATAGYMESMGVPGALLPLVIALETLGAAAIILGWQTRIVALLLAGFTLLSAVIFHGNIGDPEQQVHFLKNLSIAGAFLLLMANGAGPISIDRRVGRRGGP
ncbi:MAG TPA: DoxX family protein [Steroidobacteraceae bacterium]|nr:DoxX family protein [Steroidobacteraceae bacterium]